MDEIYKEKVPMYYFLIVVVGITCMILLIVLLSQFTSRAVPLDVAGKVILFVVFLINLIVLISFRELTITVTDRSIHFGFGKFSKKLYLENLKTVEVAEYKFRNYLGYGIRFGRDNTIGYVPRGGKGLKLKFRGEKRDYFIISDRIEELKNLLERRK